MIAMDQPVTKRERRNRSFYFEHAVVADLNVQPLEIPAS